MIGGGLVVGVGSSPEARGGAGKTRRPAGSLPSDEAFSWQFDGNEIIRWGLAYSYQSRNEAPRCKRGRSCLHLSVFRPKLDEFRSQRSSTIAAKSWRDRQQANDPNAPAGQDDRRSADRRAVPSNSGPPAVLREAREAAVSTAPEGVIHRRRQATGDIPE